MLPKITGRDDVRRAALARVVAGPLAESRALPDDLHAAILAAAERCVREVAYHESGHLIGGSLACA